MKIKYVAPARDYSGYGEASRHDLGALIAGRVQTTAEVPRYTPELCEYGKLSEMVDELDGKQLAYEVIILHTTPNVYRKHMEADKYHIGRVFWETDKLPQDFALNVQACDEIWTGSEFNKEAIRNAGVTKPIYIIPEAVDTDIEDIKPFKVPNEDDYKFYSIFEWTERKNFKTLLEAYWKEFENDKNVSLTIKTYLDNFSIDKKREIDRDIRILKHKLKLSTYPPVYLYRQLMNRNQMYRFHKTFDCFVSAHRGEGWGIPQMEALLVGNPIISTNCGGIHEYLVDGEHGYLLDYKLVPLKENNRNQQWYTQDMKWADVDMKNLRNAMRKAYENKIEMKKMGEKGQQLVKKKFSFENVGEMMNERLREIDRTILHPTDVERFQK